ncbi:MAG TPA: AMP-binding protein, partial [Beutenbergiaceae bacterium]|nr:AMP-binding protein [Beutenbergiaceae bacterium]
LPARWELPQESAGTMDLTAMFESTAHKFPHKEALVFADTAATYAELLEASKKSAAALRDAGVAKGSRVGVMTFNTPGFVVAALGIWRAGATLVPINHKLSVTEVAYLAEHSGISLGIVSEELAATASEAAPEIDWLTTNDVLTGSFDAAVGQATAWEGVAVSEDDVAQILYTSGTVSRPKGCMHSHRGLTSVAAYTSATVGLRREDRFLIAMPIWHSSPLNNWFLSMLFMGGTTVLLKEYHPIEFLKTVQEHRTTAFFGAPIAYLSPLQVAKAQGIDLSEFDLSSMRVWTYGGAPMGADTVRTLQAAYGSENFYQVYGMTEMGPVGTALYPEEQVTKAGAIGAGGMPGVDVRVMTLGGEPALPGQVGELWMRSDTRMLGYLGDPEATEAAFEGEWYRTGDLAQVDEDGYLFIVDRLKDIIITGGENVFSPEVEEALLQHPKIADAAVVSRPHPDWGETIVAVVVPAEGASVELAEVQEFLSSRLAKYKIPRELLTREALPRNASGKLTKHVLREDLAG